MHRLFYLVKTVLNILESRKALLNISESAFFIMEVPRIEFNHCGMSNSALGPGTQAEYCM